MEFEEVKKYIDRVKKSKKFKELAEFTRMTTMKKDLDIYENIKHYISTYHPRRDCKEYFQPDYEYFIKFLEQYLNDKPLNICFDNDGHIDLTKTLYLSQPPIFSAEKGNFLDRYIMLTDGTIYVSKLPLNYRGNSRVSNKDCLYSALIGSYIAKSLNVETAEITLANGHNGNRILSKYFLNSNEELITFTENKDKISDYLNEMEMSLRLRKFPEDEIQKAKIELIKQEFIAKLIGLKDQSAENSPIIISVDELGNKHVRMSPMFDLDYSFHIGEHLQDMVVRECDNGQTDISSLIIQYKEYPEFKEFVTSSIEKFDITNVFREIYENTGIKSFENYENSEGMRDFSEYANRNIQIAKETMTKIYKEERSDRE